MPPRKLVVGFILRFALIYGLLIFPWKGWDDLYGQGFRAFGNAIFGRDNKSCVLYFEAYRQTRGLAALDSCITIGNRQLADSQGNGPVARLSLDTRAIGWIPTALTMALILATPISWRRRARALCGGLLMVHILIVLSVAIYIWNESTTVYLFTLSPFWKQIGDGLENTLIMQMGASFSVPILIWITVVFRREDLTTE